MGKLAVLLFVMVGAAYSIPIDLKAKAKKDVPGISVQKTEEHHSQTVNGHTNQHEKVSEKVADPKTGKVIATAEKTKTKTDDEPATEHSKVDIPSANLHKEEEMIAPDEVAAYIFETSDYDGIKDILEKMVEDKKISKSSAADYMDEVDSILSKMHRQAFEKLQKELDESHKEDDNMFQAMLTLTDKLNEDSKILQAIQDFGQALYLKYKDDDDGYAQRLLAKFGAILEEAKRAGQLEESVQTEVLAKILEGVHEYEAAIEKSDEKENVIEDETESELHNLKH